MFKKFLAALLALAAASVYAAVDANTATQAELESVKGIGPVVSTLILGERRKSPFKDWNDMVGRVKGVGDASAARFSAGGLTVNGAAYPGAPATPAGDVAATTKVATAASKAASATAGAVRHAASATATGVRKAAAATAHGFETAASATRRKAGEAKDAVVGGAKDAEAERAARRSAKAASAAP